MCAFVVIGTSLLKSAQYHKQNSNKIRSVYD